VFAVFFPPPVGLQTSEVATKAFSEEDLDDEIVPSQEWSVLILMI
jgi:hypothetical protein